MKNKCLFLSFIISLVGCGNGLIANPCATPDAEYRSVFTHINGTCGDMFESTVQISSSGTVKETSDFSCEEYKSNGCKQDSMGCQYPVGDDVYRMDTHLTFDSDGKTASGFADLTIFADGKVICNSTYLVQYYRKDNK